MAMDVGHFGLTREDLPAIGEGPVNLQAWFAGKDETADPAQRPLELEIGSGKGTFLVQQATLTPDVNYIGVEYAREYWRHAADRIRRHNLTNVRMLHMDAAVFVRQFVPPQVFRRVHIYFPDPWPKKRHNKRRLVQEDFLRRLHRTLQPGGEVRLATDHADYFAWMQQHVERVTDLYERLPFSGAESAGEGELVGTNFERKYREAGREFFSMVLAAKRN
ncbi:MAG: tRNA (guanosine(46)-N7)-methyltransferase TrmB [Rhodospirillales bacterium]|nr:tRNA (guanosine(46)-N7)-methyltransferase TrmB [Rhodospirillales bacterium]